MQLAKHSKVRNSKQSNANAKSKYLQYQLIVNLKKLSFGKLAKIKYLLQSHKSLMEKNGQIDWNYPLRRQMKAWSSQFKDTPHQGHTVFIIGYAYSGKSTFCELCKKHVAKEPTDIRFQKPKFVLNQVISNSSVKTCTLQPQVYRIQDISLVDVPAIIMPPQVPKQTKDIQSMRIDCDIIVQYMLRMFKKSSFLLVITESNTKQRTEPWKRLIQEFLNFFDQIPDDFYDSVAFLITKAATNLKKQHFLKRIEIIRDEMQDVQVQKMLNAIIKNKAVIINYKGHDSDEKESEQVNQAFDGIKKIKCFNEMTKQLKVKILQNIPDNQKNEVHQYWCNYEVLVDNLTIYLKDLIQGLTHNSKDFAQRKQILKKQLGIVEIIKKQDNKIGNNQKQQKIPQAIDIVMMFCDLSTILSQDEGFDFSTNGKDKKQDLYLKFESRSLMVQAAVKCFYKNGLLDENNDYQINQIVNQLNQFYRMMSKSKQNLEINVRTVMDAFNVFCQHQKTNQVIKIIDQLASQQGKPREFYARLNNAFQIIEKQCAKNAEINYDQIVQVKQKIKLKLAQSATPLDTIKSLINAYKSTYQKQKSSQNSQLLFNLAKQFLRFDRSLEALVLFRKAQYPGKFLSLIDQLINKDQLQKEIVRLIFNSLDYIAFDLGLYEKALTLAYQLDDKMVQSTQRRQLASKIQDMYKMNKTNKQKVHQLNQSFINKFGEKRWDSLDAEQLKLIEEAVEIIQQDLQRKKLEEQLLKKQSGVKEQQNQKNQKQVLKQAKQLQLPQVKKAKSKQQESQKKQLEKKQESQKSQKSQSMNESIIKKSNQSAYVQQGQKAIVQEQQKPMLREDKKKKGNGDRKIKALKKLDQ